MTYPGEKFYPPGVRWDAPIARGTLPDLLSKAGEDFGDRTSIEFRDRPISFNALEAKVETAAAAFIRAGYGRGASIALFLGNTPDHPVNFFGALKAGARIVHLSPLDGAIALSHKLSDSGARVLVTSDLATLLPTAPQSSSSQTMSLSSRPLSRNFSAIGISEARLLVTSTRAPLSLSLCDSARSPSSGDRCTSRAPAFSAPKKLTGWSGVLPRNSAIEAPRP